MFDNFHWKGNLKTLNKYRDGIAIIYFCDIGTHEIKLNLMFHLDRMIRFLYWVIYRRLDNCFSLKLIYRASKKSFLVVYQQLIDIYRKLVKFHNLPIKIV